MQKVDLTVDVAGSGGAEEATLTINVEEYDNAKYAYVAYVTPSGEVNGIYPVTSDIITFPLTLSVLKGSCVYFSPDGWEGMPTYKDPSGCKIQRHRYSAFCFVQDSAASVTIYNNG